MALSDAKAAAVVHYPLGEASGNAIDSLTGNDLTETSGTIDSAAGIFGNCRDFEAGDTEYFTRADTADLSQTGEDWFATVWVNPETLSNFPLVFRKGDSGNTDREYAHYVNTGAGNAVHLQVGTGVGILEVNTPGAITTGGWHLLCVRYDSGGTIGISIDGGNFTNQAIGAAPLNGAAAFELGGSSEQAIYWDGLIDDLVIGKGYLFTNSDASALWNSGSGVAFEDWDGGGGLTVIPILMPNGKLLFVAP